MRWPVLTETKRACGMENFLTSTMTAWGLYSARILSAILVTSFSSSFQLRPSPNFSRSSATVW